MSSLFLVFCLAVIIYFLIRVLSPHKPSKCLICEKNHPTSYCPESEPHCVYCDEAGHDHMGCDVVNSFQETNNSYATEFYNRQDPRATYIGEFAANMNSPTSLTEPIAFTHDEYGRVTAY